ncbi:MAG: DUF6056 family protein [Acetatifactor sp.]|nr:DUF6056 family protein [Acetatifactor sp.]
MKERMKNLQPRAVYLIIAVGFLILHFFFKAGTHDDAWFATALDEKGLFEFLSYRYIHWTSRLPIEAVIVLLARWNPLIWRICDTLILLLLIYECNTLFGKKNAASIAQFAMLLLLLPILMMSFAGWVATTANYLWAITIGIYTLLPVRKWFGGENLKGWEWVLSCLACVFACSHEQMAAVLVIGYALIGGYALYSRKKVPAILIVYGFIAIGMMIMILLCPGNASRSVIETETWFPEFAGFSLGDKFVTGVLTTFSFFISCEEYNLIFLFLVCVLVLAVWDTAEKRILRYIPLYAFVVTAIWGLCGRVFVNLGLTTRIYWVGLLQNVRISSMSAYSAGHIFLECLVFLSVIAAVMVSLYLVCGRTLEFLCAAIILCAAFCSRMIMGMSPTVYASGSRTASPACIFMLAIAYLCGQKIGKKSLRTGYYIIYASVLLGNMVGTFL